MDTGNRHYKLTSLIDGAGRKGVVKERGMKTGGGKGERGGGDSAPQKPRISGTPRARRDRVIGAKLSASA